MPSESPTNPATKPVAVSTPMHTAQSQAASLSV